MTIYWDILLRTEKVKEKLEELYNSFQSVKALAEHLGVSDTTLRHHLKRLGIKLRSPGGAHYRLPRDYFPPEWWTLTPEQLAEETGYARRYCWKLIHKKRKELGYVPLEEEQDALQDKREND